VLTIYCLALACGPLNAQIYQGQLNLVLLALLVGSWAADRSRRPVLAGMLLAGATVIKLFPGFLLLYFILQRRWRVLLACLGSMAALTVMTMSVFGMHAYRDYLSAGLTTPWEWRSAWGNLSLLGFWNKLFDPAPRVGARVGIGGVAPIVRSAWLAGLGTVVSDLTLVSVLGWTVLKAESRSQRDIAFALCVPVVLLLSPILWSHYLVLLLLPIVLLWRTLPRSGVARWDLWIAVVALWLNPEVWWLLFIPGYGRSHGELVPSPRTTITALSIPTYALVGLFLLGLAASSRTLHGQIQRAQS
jgi:hypothetical protein